MEDSIKSIKNWIDAGGLAAGKGAADTTYGVGVKKNREVMGGCSYG